MCVKTWGLDFVIGSDVNSNIMKIAIATVFILSTVYFGQAQSTAQEYADLGEESMHEVQCTKAIGYYDQAICLDSDDANLYFSRGQAKELKGDVEGAFMDYDKSVALNERSFTAFFKRALIFHQRKNYNQAVNDFTHLIRHMKTLETTTLVFKGQADREGSTQLIGVQAMEHRKADVYAARAVTYKAMGYKEPALADFDQAILLNDRDASYFIERGLFKSENGDRDGALADYRSAVQLSPKHRIALYNLSLMVSKKEAEEINEILFEDGGFARSYSQRAFEKFESGDLSGALMDYDSALLLEKDNASDLMNRGIVKAKLSDDQGAVKDFQSSIALDEALIRNYVLLGNVYNNLEQYNDAMNYYNRYLEMNGPDAKTFYNMGVVYVKQNKNAAACQTFRQALQHGESKAAKPIAQVCL